MDNHLKGMAYSRGNKIENGGSHMIKTTLVGYGELHSKNLMTYIERLDSHLDGYYPGIFWSVVHENVKGATVKLLLEQVEEKVLVHHPNIVFINLSSNDMKLEDIHNMAITQYKEVLSSLLEKICHHNNRTGLNGCKPIPIVITPPPMREEMENEVLNNKILLAYRDAICDVVLDWNGILIDLFEHLNKKVNCKEYLSEKGLGLNQNGQDLLYDLVFVEMTKLINYQGVLKDRDEIYEEEE